MIILWQSFFQIGCLLSVHYFKGRIVWLSHLSLCITYVMYWVSLCNNNSCNTTIKEWSHTNIIKIICLFVCLSVCLFVCLFVVGGASQKRYSNHLIIIRLVSSRIFWNHWAHVKYNKLTSRCYKSTLLRYATYMCIFDNLGLSWLNIAYR